MGHPSLSSDGLRCVFPATNYTCAAAAGALVAPVLWRQIESERADMSPDRNHSAEPGLAYSLTCAVDHILRQAGGDVDLGTVHTALGLGLLLCAVPDDEDVRTWPGCARDAFLVEGGQLFGLTVRPMHPPEAARGLAGAAEFRQHFDASYRPLVMRALEHDQPVLAWCAFGGDRTRNWGIITDTCEDQLGFRGTIVTALGSETDVAVEAPPSQLYVIELLEPRRPDRNELAGAIVRHTAAALDGSLDETFGIVTGAAALGAWAARLTEVPSDVSAFGAEHAGLARSMVTDLQALVTTLEGIGPMATCAEGERAEQIHAATRQLVDGLTPLTDAEAVSMAAMAPQDVVEMRERVTTARKTVEALASALM